MPISFFRESRVFSGFLKIRMMEFFSNKMDLALDIMGMMVRVAITGFIGVVMNRYGNIPKDLLQGAPDYVSFILIAHFVDILIWSAEGNISRFVVTGRFANLYTTPSSLGLIIMAANSWRYVWILFQAVFFLAFGILGFRMTFHLNLGMLIVIPTGMLLLMAIDMAASGIKLVSKSGTDPITWTLMITSQLLSGSFFPIEVLPPWLRMFSKVHPQYYIITLSRKTIGGGQSLASVWPQLRGFMITTAVFLVFGYLLFKWGFRRARMDGTLGHR